MYKKWSKQITAMVMALAMLLSAMGVFAADANDTILSETFEGNPIWNKTGNTNFATDITHGGSGQSLKLDGGSANKTFFAPDSEGYEPGIYTFTCWVYAGMANANPFTVYTSAGANSFDWVTSDNVVSPANLGTTYNQWVKIREKMVIAEGQKTIYIGFEPRNGYYVDDISITKGYSMIENTGFEDDLNGGWTLGTDVTNGQIAVTTEQKHSGNKALKVHANATDTSVGPHVMAMYPVAVDPGKTYTVSFWLYVEEGLTLASTMQLFACKAATYTTWGDANANLAMTPTKTVNQKWVKLTGTITTTNTTKYLQLVFIKRSSAAAYYIDDITVDEVATGVRIEKNDEGTLYGLDAVEAGAWQVTGHLAGEDTSAMVVAAVYKVSGDVRSLVSVDIQSATNAADGLANVTVPEDDGEYEIKAMLWEDMTGLSPRLRTVTLS